MGRVNKTISKEQASFIDVFPNRYGKENGEKFTFEVWPNNYNYPTYNHLYCPEVILNIDGNYQTTKLHIFYKLGKFMLELKAIKLYLAKLRFTKFSKADLYEDETILKTIYDDIITLSESKEVYLVLLTNKDTLTYGFKKLISKFEDISLFKSDVELGINGATNKVSENNETKITSDIYSSYLMWRHIHNLGSPIQVNRRILSDKVLGQDIKVISSPDYNTKRLKEFFFSKHYGNENRGLNIPLCTREEKLVPLSTLQTGKRIQGVETSQENNKDYTSEDITTLPKGNITFSGNLHIQAYDLVMGIDKNRYFGIYGYNFIHGLQLEVPVIYDFGIIFPQEISKKENKESQFINFYDYDRVREALYNLDLELQDSILPTEEIAPYMKNRLEEVLHMKNKLEVVVAFNVRGNIKKIRSTRGSDLNKKQFPDKLLRSKYGDFVIDFSPILEPIVSKFNSYTK